MTTVQKRLAAVRSFLTTVVAVLVGLIGLDSIEGVEIPTQWIVWATVALGVLRTCLAAIDPGMKLFGIGSGDDTDDGEGG